MNKTPLQVHPISTDVFRVGENLFEFLERHLKTKSLEGNVLAITSKIVSLSENQIINHKSLTKRQLVEQEADHYLCEGGFGVELTIKHGILIPSAGIDESNSESGDYILFPKDPFQSAQKIWSFLKEKFKLQNFGVIITDSHTMPLRRGVTGIALSHWGIRATNSLIGQEDLFGRPLKFTHVNVVDSLAVMAVFAMGEANEASPLALVSGAKVEFTHASDQKEIQIEPELDLYFPLLKPFMKK